MTAVTLKPASCSRSGMDMSSMSQWSGRQEEMMDMIGAVSASLGSTEFRDRDIEATTFACCSCASGQSGAINFCKHER